MKITLQMIADRVGVTCASVSMALRNNPQISRARREEIKKVAEDLGYCPNALVSSLMSHIRQAKPAPQRTGLLYLVSGPTATPGVPGSMFDLYFRGAAEQAARRGFHLEPFWVREPGLTDARIGKILWTRRIPGIIVGPREDALPLPRLPWEQLATVAIGYSFAEPLLDRMVTNFYNSTRLAMAFLKEELYPPVRLILPESHDRNVLHLWTAGYLQERQQQTRKFQTPLIVNAPDKAVNWVRQNHGCTVLGTNLVLEWLRHARLREHEHFRFVSLNVDTRTELTGIREASLLTGADAADLVISRILLNRMGLPENPHVTLIEPAWQDGQWNSR